MKRLCGVHSTTGGYGYSIVGKHVAKGLRDAGNRTVILGMQTVSKAIEDEFGDINLPINANPWGADVLHHYLTAYDIDTFISILDLWVQQSTYIPPLVQKLQIPWIAHCTCNSEPLSPYLAARLVGADKIVAPSKWNYKLLQDAGLGSKSVYIPHGVNTQKFYPMTEEEKQKTKEEWGIEDKKFIVGIVNRNKGPQKNFPCLYHAWKIFLESVPDAKKDSVLIHLCDPTEMEGTNLLDLVNRVGLQDNIKFVRVLPTDDWKGLKIARFDDSKAFYPHANFKLTESELLKLYNIFDIHVIPSMGESFGLPTIESMACGVPNILANFGVGPELISEGEPTPRGMLAELVKEKSGEPYLTSTPLLSAISNPSPQSMAEAIYKFYTDEEFRKLCSRNARKFAEKYDWKFAIERWVKLIEELNVPSKVDYARGILGI